MVGRAAEDSPQPLQCVRRSPLSRKNFTRARLQQTADRVLIDGYSRLCSAIKKRARAVLRLLQTTKVCGVCGQLCWDLRLCPIEIPPFVNLITILSTSYDKLLVDCIGVVVCVMCDVMCAVCYVLCLGVVCCVLLRCDVSMMWAVLLIWRFVRVTC